MTVPLPSKKPIDMTFRMWSDHVPLKPFLDQMAVNVEHIHVAGELIANGGRFAGRIAHRHYASIANVRGNDNKDISAWLIRVVELVEKQQNLVTEFVTGQITALLWIAIFGRESASMPSLDPQLVDSCSRLGLKIILENYTDLDLEGVPKRVWLTPM